MKVGPSSATTTPVLDGIKAGDRVVVSGAQKLADGAPIQARAATSRQPSATES